jgi:hypothetical protein
MPESASLIALRADYGIVASFSAGSQCSELVSRDHELRSRLTAKRCDCEASVSENDAAYVAGYR